MELKQLHIRLVQISFCQGNNVLHRISRGIKEITCRISRGFHRKEVEFPRVIKNQSCGISWGLGF